MTAQQYEKISAPFRSPRRQAAVRLGNQLVTRLCYAAYPILLLALGLQRDGRFLRALIVPALAFCLLTLVRSSIHAPRPYEVLDIQPIIHKNTKGKSMPSRHAMSVFVIAMTFFWILPPLGILLLLLGVMLAAIRVIGGVHFPRDVLAGALFGIASALIGFWLI